MSGLIALLDDVAGIAKVAAASVDDVAGMSAKATAKAAGAVIDDAAVTPKYVHGFDADREVPIIWRIAKGSIFNKLVILLPVALLLSVLIRTISLCRWRTDCRWRSVPSAVVCAVSSARPQRLPRHVRPRSRRSGKRPNSAHGVKPSGVQRWLVNARPKQPVRPQRTRRSV